MIQLISLEDIDVEELIKEFTTEGEGKVLKIFIDLDSKAKIEIFTSENERVLSVDENGTYYPRANITSQKYTEDPLSVEGETKFDYYYFKGLFIIIEKETNEPLKINRLSILYDDLR